MEHLENFLRQRGMTDFSSKDRRIMCFPHIINLCTQRIISKLTEEALVDSDEEFTPESRYYSKDPGVRYDEIVRNDPIAIVRKVVKRVRASGQRRQEFTQAIADYNRDGHNLHQLQLILDVKTRWDSTYRMIVRYFELRWV